MYVEQPDRFGQLLLTSIVIWGGLGGLVWLGLVLTFSGKPTHSGPPPIPAALARAQEVFTQRCVACHGSTGHGDGPASASLSPRPRQFADPQWQASVTDEHIERIIQYGGAAVGKSPAMPNNPDLQSEPETIIGLRKLIRRFKP